LPVHLARRLQQWAVAHQRTPEERAIDLIAPGRGATASEEALAATAADPELSAVVAHITATPPNPDRIIPARGNLADLLRSLDALAGESDIAAESAALRAAEAELRAINQAALTIRLSDADAEIAPIPTSGTIHTAAPELDRLSNILKIFNDQFGNIAWTDADRVQTLITQEIPARVAADPAYQNAQKHSDRQNARIEHDRALARVLIEMMKDDTELFKQFSDNPGFKKWLSDLIFAETYQQAA
jgi:hypothetical protein